MFAWETLNSIIKEERDVLTNICKTIENLCIKYTKDKYAFYPEIPFPCIYNKEMI